MNFSGFAACLVNRHFVPAGNPAPPRPRTLAASTCWRSSSEPSSFSARRSPDQSPGSVSTGSDSRLRQAGSGAGGGAVRDHPRDHVGAGVDRLAVAHGGGGVAEAEADGLDELVEPSGERSPSLSPSVSSIWSMCSLPVAAKQAVPVQTRTWRLAASDEQVVVERGDAIHRGLRHPGELRGAPAVVIGHLAVVLDRFLQHLQRGRRVDCVVAANQLNEVLRHMSPWRRGLHGFVPIGLSLTEIGLILFKLPRARGPQPSFA